MPIDTRDILTRISSDPATKRICVQMKGVGEAVHHVPDWSYGEIILFDRACIGRQRIRFPIHPGFAEPEVARPLQWVGVVGYLTLCVAQDR